MAGSESGYLRMEQQMLYKDCCLVNYHYKNTILCAGLVQRGHHHHFIEKYLVLAMI